MSTQKLTIFQEYKDKGAPERATIMLDIPYGKLKMVLEKLSRSGRMFVDASDVADCGGENILNVIVD